MAGSQSNRLDTNSHALSATASAISPGCDFSGFAANNDPDEILGLWYDPVVNQPYMLIEQGEAPGSYIQIEREDTESFYADEITTEVTWIPSCRIYVGRHKWSKTDTDPSYWGTENGVVIFMQNEDLLIIRFLDSKYTGGWQYTRVDE